MTHVHWHHLRQRMLPCIVALTAIVLLLGACDASTSRTPTPTHTAIATPLPTRPSEPQPSPVVSLDPAPGDCTAVPPPDTFTTTDGFGGGFSGGFAFAGRSPVWGEGISTALHVPSNRGEYPSMKTMWVVGPNFAKPVTLTGRDLRGGTPLWFEIYPSLGGPLPSTASVYTTRAVLDPAAPNRGATDNSTGHWNIWGIGLYVLKSGCYQLDATWDGGSWRAIFAAGS